MITYKPTSANAESIAKAADLNRKLASIRLSKTSISIPIINDKGLKVDSISIDKDSLLCDLLSNNSSFAKPNMLALSEPQLIKFNNSHSFQTLVRIAPESLITTPESLAKRAIVEFKEAVIANVVGQLDLIIGDVTTLLSQDKILHAFNPLSVDLPQLNLSSAIALQDAQRYAVAIATHKDRLSSVKIVSEAVVGSLLTLRVVGVLPEQYQGNVNTEAFTADRAKLTQAIELFAGDNSMITVMQGKLTALDSQFELTIELKE